MKTKHLLSLCATGMLLLQPSDTFAIKPKTLANGFLITTAGVLYANQLYKTMVNESEESAVEIAEATVQSLSSATEGYFRIDNIKTNGKKCFYFYRMNSQTTPSTWYSIHLNPSDKAQLIDDFILTDPEHGYVINNLNNVNGGYLKNRITRNRVIRILTAASFQDITDNQTSFLVTSNILNVSKKIAAFSAFAGLAFGGLFTYAIMKSYDTAHKLNVLA